MPAPRHAAGGNPREPGRRAPGASRRRASRFGQRLWRGSISDGAGATSDDPVLQALRAGPLKVSTLAHRLGRDPASRLLRLRQQGMVELVQDLRSPGFRHVQVAVRTPQPLEARGKAQAEVLARLEQAGGRIRVADLVRDRPSLRGAIGRLVELGALRLEEERDVRGPETMAGGTDTRPTPTKDQATALAALQKAADDRGFRPFLLHGVTGSGKTEVYFRAAERVLGAGKTVLMLVPEIALTPLLVRAAVARFGNTVAVQHSELSAGERHDQWWRIREGDARVVVGARSAVFAPLPALGLVVVDEEHEASYKQEDSPRYHARDVAVMRARLEGATVVLGSATPSLESRMNADRGKYASLLHADPHFGAGAAAGRDRGPPRRAQGGRRSHPEPAAARRPRRASRPEGAGAAAPEPARLGHEPRVPRVRAAGRLPQLLGVPDPARRGPALPSATTAATAPRPLAPAPPAGAPT